MKTALLLGLAALAAAPMTRADHFRPRFDRHQQGRGFSHHRSYESDRTFRTYGTYGSYRDRHLWRGVAWGAGLSWALSAAAEVRQPMVYAQPAVVTLPGPTPIPAAEPAIRQITFVHDYDTRSPMSSANVLFGR
jgi:hypothetical protein